MSYKVGDICVCTWCETIQCIVRLQHIETAPMSFASDDDKVVWKITKLAGIWIEGEKYKQYISQSICSSFPKNLRKASAEELLEI